MGGPLSGRRGRQSGRRAPIGQQAGGGGARAVLPGGQRRLLFQEDLDALSPRRPQQRFKEPPPIFKEPFQ